MVLTSNPEPLPHRLSHGSPGRLSMLVLIDADVVDHAILVAGAVAGAEVIVLNPYRDGIDEITDLLLARPNVTAVHIVSYGAPGRLFLGIAQLSLATLEHYTPQLTLWFQSQRSLPAPPHLGLYGCRVASGAIGLEFVHSLHYLTGAEVSASSTQTGNSALGGNWHLDVTTSSTVLPLAFRPEILPLYAGVLHRH